ncbi:efflux RND transporter permease subunit [Companilactobacillus sp.]|jgi:hydrophobe/amphiphile efflux-3 (HAE3) family protein|uniref:efflux RND transporter permease subunit n=1 Tax=Companilactobacillus sp. TaxID=2767905 RepID=UPI0025C6566A|nr:hydrophobe/amphiphile efflux-3 (HAE3) family transporter [Companilactobacillus sp.]MCH4010056.1 hydrophobe/amphiphile efflux-3 (HAE3) family transporter [Companilactobacillus sp.]MCH4052268.1 hydrophobe/amphiphile efflux-3 (HAE3) family transporter [Companilactobacillus sp.]MCH4077998.1 hydrophobe/amphiphile efflux-3 (HAE3) family transporter [Companilactobacillus sp.]MCH4126574.1 hydrophobe/amphiphile efflux-3 (HAE3) family transporter [Companilactobacillus sp.]MCH4132159.1 hydrophobe/amph
MQKFFTMLSNSVHKHAKLWITFIAVVTIVLAFGLPRIQMKFSNDVFVNPNSKAYKDTSTYQKNFGGDAVYVMVSGKQDDVLSQQNMKKLAKLDKKLSKMDNVRSTTNIVNLLNDEMGQIKKNPSAAQNMSGLNLNLTPKAEKDLMANLSNSDKSKLMTQVQSGLTTEQQAQVQTYVTGILTDAQKQQVAAAQQQAQAQIAQLPAAQQQAAAAEMTSQQSSTLMGMLTDAQKQQVQAYTLTLINDQQKQALTAAVLPMIPKVQNMSNALLRDILLSDNGKVPSAIQQLLPKNGKHTILMVNTKSTTDMNTNVKLMNDVHKAVNEAGFSSKVKVRTAGNPVVIGQVKNVVIQNMAIMVVIAVIIMIIILALIFPVRRRILPLFFVLIGMIWTFGAMGWFNLPITLATMATLPIIIGLGTDFGVQFQNRYEDEYRQTEDSEGSIKLSITKMGPAVGIAVIVMIFSFLTMFLSKAPMMQQFGVTLALGVFCAYIVEFFMMFSTFTLIDKSDKAHEKFVKKNEARTAKHNGQDTTRLSQWLGSYARFITKHAGWVFAIAVVLGGLGFAVEHNINTETDIMKMIPQNMSELQNTKYLQKQVGSTVYIDYLVKGNDVRKADTIKKINKLGNQEKDKYKDITGVTSLSSTYKQLGGDFNASQSTINTGISNIPKSLKQTVISDNNNYATIQFKIDQHLSTKDQQKLMDKIDKDIGGNHNGLQIAPAGLQVMMLIGIDNVTSNHNLIMFAGLAIIFIVLLLVYREFRLAIYPVLPILVVLGLSPLTLWLMHTSYNPVTIALSSLVLGIGTEFTILILERYREERLNNVTREKAIIDAVSKVGQAITVSGLTVIGGFSAIMFASFPVLRSFGLITVLDTAYSLISALTVLPALVYLFRNRKEDRELEAANAAKAADKKDDKEEPATDK